MHGICHLEIPAHDLNRIQKFYHDIFGWDTHAFDESYALFKAPTGPGGGFSTYQKPVDNPGFNFYIEVEDIDATLAKVKTSGGSVEKEKTQISAEFGFMAFIKDSEGNMIGLWSAK